MGRVKGAGDEGRVGVWQAGWSVYKIGQEESREPHERSDDLEVTQRRLESDEIGARATENLVDEAIQRHMLRAGLVRVHHSIVCRLRG